MSRFGRQEECIEHTNPRVEVQIEINGGGVPLLIDGAALAARAVLVGECEQIIDPAHCLRVLLVAHRFQLPRVRKHALDRLHDVLLDGEHRDQHEQDDGRRVVRKAVGELRRLPVAPCTPRGQRTNRRQKVHH